MNDAVRQTRSSAARMSSRRLAYCAFRSKYGTSMATRPTRSRRRRSNSRSRLWAGARLEPRVPLPEIMGVAPAVDPRLDPDPGAARLKEQPVRHLDLRDVVLGG